MKKKKKMRKEKKEEEEEEKKRTEKKKSFNLLESHIIVHNWESYCTYHARQGSLWPSESLVKCF
jgi:hypothetical protein